MVSKDVIADVVEDWSGRISGERIIGRNLMQLLLDSLPMEEITVLTGVRRSGKTFMLYDLFRRKGGTYVNFEDERLHDFRLEDFDKLLEIAEERGPKILYLDEVQESPGWEKFAHRAHRRMKFVVTGSNSCLLSADFSKALVGRTRTFLSRPLDFGEFLRFKGKRSGSRPLLLEYMRLGGFPRIVLTGDTGLSREYLDRIVHRDIVAKNEIRNPGAVMDLALYLLSNVGKEFSYRSLKEVSGLRHDATVKQYLRYMEEVFLFSTLKRHSGSLRKQETYPKKIYATDPSFIGLGKRLDDDRGLVLENLVFNHLAGRGDIYFERNGGEVDFLLCRGTRPVEAVNVTYEVNDRAAFDREMRGLLRIAGKHGIKTRLVSVYPVSGLPGSVEGRLAHRFLAGAADKVHARASL
jgi:predicted AAA+ superfamily ATPase